MHGIADFDFATVSGCDHVVVNLSHSCREAPDQLITDVVDLEWVAVVAPISNSDHSSLPAVISMAKVATNLYVSRKVFLKRQINWNTFCGAPN